jgi:hypothetical protein
MSDERALHDDGMLQDWTGGPAPDPREAEVEAHYQDWKARQPIRTWLRDQLGLPLETDAGHDIDQDKRATGPGVDQERRARGLDEEQGRFTAW